MARPERGSSRLWELAEDTATTEKAIDLLKWAGTSLQAFDEAKIYVNPPLVK
jgi:hypothetical protein